MDAIPIDKRVFQAVAILGNLIDKGERIPLRNVCNELGFSYNSACEIIAKLGGIVSAEQGRNGGIKVINEHVTIGEISQRLGSEIKLGETIYEQRFRTALNRLNRIRLSDLAEKDV